MIPLFPGVPGGPELLVVLLLAVGLFGLPVVLAFLGWRHLKGDRLDQLHTLEARVDELEDELDVDDTEREPAGDGRTGTEGTQGGDDP